MIRLLRILLVVAVLLGLAVAYLTQPLLWPPPWSGRANVNVDPARLLQHVRKLSEELQRDASQPRKLDEVATYIRSELEHSGARVSDQPYEVRGATYRNVIASFGPETGERIVVGAHYDAAEGFPGADDNASGVAGLLELAPLLGKADLHMRVDLVAFTLEEPPYFRTSHMGSAVHVASLKQAGVAVRLMISLEMIGYFSDAADSQEFPLRAMRWLYPTTGNFITVTGCLGEGWLVRRIKRTMAAASDLPVYSLNAPREGLGIDLSDQRNYWAAGYNAVMISDTAFFRNNRYHTAGDTADRLDYSRMAKVVTGTYAAVIQAANP